MLNVNLDRLAEACGYDRILWDEANNCWSGFGSSDPADRSRDDAGGFLVASADAELEAIAEREGCTLTAGDFAERIEFPVVFVAGVGSPAGEHVAILEETVLPFDLEELHGTISENGVFEATDIDGETDCNGNTVYKVQVFSSERIWTEQNDDYMREGGMTAYVIRFSNGEREIREWLDGDSEAIDFVESVLSERGHDITEVVSGDWDADGEDDDGNQCERMLFWASEEDAENDSGAKSICELRVVRER